VFSSRLRRFQQRVEALKIGFPNLAAAVQPFTGFGERLRYEAAGAALGILGSGDQTRAFEDFEVFGNGRLRHSKRLGEFGDGGQEGEDGPAGGVGESGESGAEAFGRRFLNSH
jgi:hypothetical protein